MKQIEWLLNQRIALTLSLILVLPFSLWGAYQSLLSNSNNVNDWMPSEFEAIQQLTRFSELFGAAELLMVSWPECTLEDPRIGEFESRLMEPAGDGREFFRDVLTGPEIYAQLSDRDSRIPEDEILPRMAGWIVSPDGQLTGLICFVSADGAEDRHAAVAHVFAAADAVPGITREQIHVAGPTIEGVAIDNATTTNLLWLNIASFLICFAIMLVCLRSVRAAIVILAVALFNEQLSLAIIYYSGTNLDSVLMLAANLTFVLTISIGIHLFNYYREALRTETPQRAAARALLAAFRPTALATITTSLGLLSLTVSDIRPLMRFGAYATVSVLISAIVTLIYVALHFHIWPIAKSRDTSGPSRSGDQLFAFVQRTRWPIIIAAGLMLVIGFWGAQRIRTSVGLNHLLSSKTRAIQDYQWLEDRFGPLVPVEVVVAMPAGDARETLAQFRQIERLHRAMQAYDPTSAVISCATFAPPPPPEKGGVRQRTAIAAFRVRLVENQQRLANLGYLRFEEETNYWRLTMRAPALADVDYGAMLADLRTMVDEQFEEESPTEPEEVLICGGVALVYQVQEQLLTDLFKSFLTAFGLVCLTLMILFRSVRCGLICMIPNLLPTALVFGTIGWLGIRVEVGTVLTASAALGIAIDDSLHFITWFRRSLMEGGTIRQAVTYAYHRCSAAMIQTTLVCTLGLVVFAFSPFAPMQRFGWCMFALLFAALIADLIVLPAILLSPLGRPFLPKVARQSDKLVDLDHSGVPGRVTG